MTGRTVLGAALIGIGLVAVAVSWGKAIWRQFIEGVDEGWEAEMRQVFPELYDEDGRP